MKKELITTEDYLRISARAEERFELHHGELVAMGRTTGQHSEISLNAAFQLKQALKGRDCKVYSETVAVQSQDQSSYFLPDVMVTCDERDHADHSIKRYPSLIIEVLSDESVRRDFGKKLRAYTEIPSVMYYLIISQDLMLIQVYARQEEKSGWEVRMYDQPQQLIELPAMKVSITVADVYDGVELPPEEPGQDDGDQVEKS